MALDPSILSQFTRTERYYRLNRRCLITDFAKYHADEAGAYFLLDALVLQEIRLSDFFLHQLNIIS